MELTKVIIVALISLSPVGEELIAIPAGLAMGLPVFLAAGVAAVANFLPVPALFFVFDRAIAASLIFYAVIFALVLNLGIRFIPISP